MLCKVPDLTGVDFPLWVAESSRRETVYPSSYVPTSSFTLQSRDCLQLGPPAEGEVVQVRWTDGQVYGAKFVASHAIQMYQVLYCLKINCLQEVNKQSH